MTLNRRPRGLAASNLGRETTSPKIVGADLSRKEKKTRKEDVNCQAVISVEGGGGAQILEVAEVVPEAARGRRIDG